MTLGLIKAPVMMGEQLVPITGKGGITGKDLCL